MKKDGAWHVKKGKSDGKMKVPKIGVFDIAITHPSQEYTPRAMEQHIGPCLL